MLLRDLTRLTTSSVFAHPVRSLLTTTGVAIGIGAVVLLTSIGQGVNRYVVTHAEIRTKNWIVRGRQNAKK